MGLLDRFKKKTDKKEAIKVKPPKVKADKEDKKTAKDDYSSLRSKTEPGLQPVPVKGVKTKKTKKQDTKDAYKVLIKPLITEKATELVSKNKYAFEVGKRANKIEIKNAMKDLYAVDVLDVNIINMKGKKVRYGKVSGKKKNWKKAIITLKESDKIEIYEGV